MIVIVMVLVVIILVLAVVLFKFSSYDLAGIRILRTDRSAKIFPWLVSLHQCLVEHPTRYCGRIVNFG